MKTLKCACVFYFERWWLPPLCIPIWALLSILAMMALANYIGSYVVDYDVLVVSLLTLGAELSIFVWLGVPISWIWLLFHKQWLKALWNFLFVALLLCFPFFVELYLYWLY